MKSYVFATMDDLWRSICEDVYIIGDELDSRDGPSRELLGTSLRLTSPLNNVLANPVRKFSPWYATAELLWYLSGENNIERVVAYAPQYERFASEDGVAHGAYGARFYHDQVFQTALWGVTQSELDPNSFAASDQSSQLDVLAGLIKRAPNTRQAVISIWNASDLVYAYDGKCRDIPCTLSLQFILRQGLHCIATMRSNDVWLGLPYDVFCFTSIQKLLADILNVKVGVYVHNVGSMHLYERDVKKLEQALNVSYEPTRVPHDHRNSFDKEWRFSSAIREACFLETVCRDPERVKKMTPEALLKNIHNACRKNSLLSDLVVTCGAYWNVFPIEEIISPLLKEAAHAHSRGNGPGRKDDALQGADARGP